MLTKYDPYVNMLRTTVAAFAAGVGGAYSPYVSPNSGGGVNLMNPDALGTNGIDQMGKVPMGSVDGGFGHKATAGNDWLFGAGALALLAALMIGAAMWRSEPSKAAASAKAENQ